MKLKKVNIFRLFYYFIHVSNILFYLEIKPVRNEVTPKSNMKRKISVDGIESPPATKYMKVPSQKQKQALPDDLLFKVPAVPKLHKTVSPSNSSVIRTLNVLSLSTESSNCDRLNEMNSKCVQLTIELSKAQTKNTDLSASLGATLAKNAYLTSTNKKFQEKNASLVNSLKKIEAMNNQLISMNKKLTDEKIKLTSTNRTMAIQLNEIQHSSDIVKENAFEKCTRIMTETKKKQWCMGCGNSGGQYFCSPQCQQLHKK